MYLYSCCNILYRNKKTLTKGSGKRCKEYMVVVPTYYIHLWGHMQTSNMHVSYQRIRKEKQSFKNDVCIQWSLSCISTQISHGDLSLNLIIVKIKQLGGWGVCVTNKINAPKNIMMIIFFAQLLKIYNSFGLQNYNVPKYFFFWFLFWIL